MDNFIIALIETSAALLFFYFVYVLWLRKLTYFHENRFYLLLTALFSLIIPWLSFNLPATNAQATYIYNVLGTVSIVATGYEQTLVQTLTAWQWLGLVYLVGVVFMLLLFIFKLIKLVRISEINNEHSALTTNSQVKFTEANVVPFSFLNKIYINPKNYTKENLNEIIAHEKVHVNQQHTYDCLFYELLIVFFWFNPIVYKYRKAAKEIHEFLADEGAIKMGVEKEAYQKLLFEEATGVSMLSLANSFNYSLIKNRLVMLTKMRSSKIAKARLLMVLPIVLMLIAIFACNEVIHDDLEPQVKTYVDANGNEVESEYYYEVEEMPEFPGGTLELRKFIAINVAYPKLAKELGTEGRIYIQFIVNEVGVVEAVKHVGTRQHDDKSSKVEEVVVVGYAEGASEKDKAFAQLVDEAIRVVELLPEWKPGKHNGKNVKVAFTIPINFQLN